MVVLHMMATIVNFPLYQIKNMLKVTCNAHGEQGVFLDRKL